MSRISSWLAGAVDPTRFVKRFGMKPDPWQAQVLRSTAPRIHLLASRQVGKSTTVAQKALHRSIYMPGSTVLILSPSDRQSGELYAKVAAFYRTLGKVLETARENMHELVLENGSRIVSLPASAAGVRGYSASLVLVDEAAFVDDELFEAISPMLAVAVNAQLIAMGTPFHQRGWFFEASRSPHWEHYKVPASECPRISKEFLELELATLGPRAFAREYECSFEAAAGSLFTREDIDLIFNGAVPSRSLGLAPAIEAPRRPTDAEQLQMEQARVLQTIAGRFRTRQADAKRTRRTCVHRWGQDSDGIWRCRWNCGATRGEESA